MTDVNGGLGELTPDEIGQLKEQRRKKQLATDLHLRWIEIDNLVDTLNRKLQYPLRVMQIGPRGLADINGEPDLTPNADAETAGEQTGDER